MASKYEALEIYLHDQAAIRAQVTMSFKEIEAVIGAPLPRSAFTYREWWSNQKEYSSRPQAKAWLAAGYEVDSVVRDRPQGQLTFAQNNTQN